MRKEILDALKAKFTGVSDAILGRIADKLAKTATTAEQVATAVEGVTFQQVLESYGDSRATEAQQTAVLEKPLYFDPFGQTEFTPLAII